MHLTWMNMKYRNENGWGIFSDLNIPESGGVKFEYYCRKNQRWFPGCIFPTLKEKELFEPNNGQDWNWATTWKGLVRKELLDGDEVFWNYYINFNGIPKKSVNVRITVYGKSGKDAVTTEMEVFPEPENTIFLNNWDEWGAGVLPRYNNLSPNRISDPDNAPEGWCLGNCSCGQPRLSLFGKKAVEPLRYKPGISGKYDLYICLKEHVLKCSLELPGKSNLYKIDINPQIMPWNKWWKEIYVGQFDFKNDDLIGIHQVPATIYNPVLRFGDLYYIKLVPANRELPDAQSYADKVKEIVFYSEPYSLAYYHLLQNEKMAEKLVDEYLDLGVDKIICQMGRIGSFMVYPSKIAVRARCGEMQGDDHQKSNGVNEMMENMDILEVLPDACHRKGIKFIANLGLNMPYVGTNLETEFVAEHHEYIYPVTNCFLDFAKPEVIDFAAEHFKEIVEYDIDGIAVDHLRYCFGQSTETIVNFHRKIVEKITLQRRNDLEINIRFPANDPDYYEALEIMFRENLVDTIIPSNEMCIYPVIDIAEYVRLANRYGKRIYCCFDGWSYNYSQVGYNKIPNPFEFEQLGDYYMGQGADGIFFYQSEQLLGNIFLRRFLETLAAAKKNIGK